MSDADRRRAYSEINEVVKTTIARYVAEFPEYADDARHKESLAWSTRSIARIYRVLDSYTITRKPPESGPKPKEE